MSVAVRRCLLLALLIVAGIGGWFAFRPGPAKLLQRGFAVGRRDVSGGEKLIREAIAHQGGKYPDAQMGLALLFANHDDWSRAETEFYKVDSELCRTDYLEDFGRKALEAGRDSLAEEALIQVGRRRKKEGDGAFESLVMGLQAAGSPERAIEAARRWADAAPDNPRPWMLMYAVLKKLERRDAECLEAVREALARNPVGDDRVELHRRYVEQLIVCGQAETARSELAALVQVVGEPFQIRLLEMDLFRLEGKPEQALELMNRVFDQARDPAEASFNRSMIYHDLGKYAEAARDLERTVAAQPQNAAAHFKLSEAYRALGRMEPARKHRELAGEINMRQSRLEGLLRQVRREATNAELAHEIAELYRQQGSDEAARKWSIRAEQLGLPAGN